MTIAFIASTQAITTASISVPSNSDGDFLLLFCGRSYASTTVIDIAAIEAMGWTYVWDQGIPSGTTVRTALFWKIASSEPGSYNIGSAFAGGNYVNIMHSYSGVDTVNPIQAFRWKNDGSAGSHALGTLAVRPSHTGMAVGFCSAGRGLTLTAPASPWTSAGGGSIGGTGTSNTAARGAYKAMAAEDYTGGTFAFGNSAVAYLVYIALKAADQAEVTAVRDFSSLNTFGSPTMPNTVRVGDLLIALASSRAGGTVAAPAGWDAMAANVSQAGYSQRAFWRVATAADVAAGRTQPYTFTGPAVMTVQLYVIPEARFGTAASATTATGNTTLPALTFPAQSPSAMMWAYGCIRGDVGITAGASGYTAHSSVATSGASGGLGQYAFYGWSAGPDAAATSLAAGATPTNGHHIELGDVLRSVSVAWVF